MKLRHAMWVITATLLACGGEQPDQAQTSEGAEAAPLAGTVQGSDQLACEPQRDPAGRASPYDSTRFAVGYGEIMVCYVRLRSRGRIMSSCEIATLVRPWRT